MSYKKLGSGTVTLAAGDLEVGAVEVKNATSDVRAVVQAASSAADTTVGLAVADGNLHTSLGAVGAAADVDGTLHAQFRFIGEAVDGLEADLAKLEARIAQPNMLTAPTIVAIDTSSAAATALTVGTTYMVYVTAPAWVEVGGDAVAAATTNTYIEPGMVFVWTPTADDTDDGIACISTVAGGSMYVQACQA